MRTTIWLLVLVIFDTLDQHSWFLGIACGILFWPSVILDYYEIKKVFLESL